MIEVTYDGHYPNARSGTLTIKKDGEVLYSERYCCSSSAHVWFDNRGAHIESGKLITWDDADKFSEEIQQAVEDVLSRVGVCCGGCV